MGKPKKYNSKELTNHLRQLAAEAHDWSEKDGLITKGEALARLLWAKALGWEEVQIDDEGNERTVKHPPEAWAIQLVYDRMEGKTPQAVTEDEARMTAADQVRELARARLNQLAAASTKKDKPAGPPKFKRRPKDEQDS